MQGKVREGTRGTFLTLGSAVTAYSVCTKLLVVLAGKKRLFISFYSFRTPTKYLKN
jgi:hypothetical protein